MHTYKMERLDNGKYLVREGWNIGEYGVINYQEDELLGKIIPAEKNFFDGCLVYWNESLKSFCNLDFDELEKYARKRLKALKNPKELVKAEREYYDYLVNPVLFSGGEEEARYVVKHKGGILYSISEDDTEEDKAEILARYERAVKDYLQEGN